MTLRRKAVAVIATAAVAIGVAGGAAAAPTGEHRTSTPYAVGEVSQADTSINDATLATLAEFGVDLDVSGMTDVPGLTMFATVDQQRAAEVYAEHAPMWEPSADTEGRYGIALRVMSPQNHDSGAYRSPYKAGDWAGTEGAVDPATGLLTGHDIAHSGEFTTTIHGNTSYHEGGVPTSGMTPFRTWVTDDFAKPVSVDFTTAREKAGYRSHNQATFSTATDGDTTLIVQAFVIKGEMNEGYWDVDEELAYQGSRHNAVALTDGLELVLDTSPVKWVDTPVDEEGWDAGAVPPGYSVFPIEDDDPTRVFLARESINGFERNRELFLVGDTAERSSIANWQDAPPLVEEVTDYEATLGFYNNRDDSWGPVLTGEFQEYDLSHTPTVITWDDASSTYSFVAPARDGAYLSAGSWFAEDGTYFEWDEAVAVDGELTVTFFTTANAVAVAEGIPSFGGEDEMRVITDQSFFLNAYHDWNDYAFPYANDDHATTPQDTPVDIEVFNNDGLGNDPVEAGILPLSTWTGGDQKHTFGQASNGTVEPVVFEFEMPDDHDFTEEEVEEMERHQRQRVAYKYTPAPGFTGTDSFPYSWLDDDGQRASATAYITVTPVETPTEAPPVEEPPTEEPPVEVPPTEEPPVTPPTAPPAPPATPPTTPPDTPDVPGRPDTGVSASVDAGTSDRAATPATADNADKWVLGLFGALAMLAGIGFALRNRVRMPVASNGRHRA